MAVIWSPSRSVWALAIAATMASCSRRTQVLELTITDGALHWRRGGYVEVVPTVRPPTSRSGDLHITTWIKPSSARLRARAGRLEIPTGWDVVRVELRGTGLLSADWVILDVRGTRFGSDRTERFYSLRPVSWAGPAELRGPEWLRGDTAQQRIADDYIAKIASLAMADQASADRASSRARMINQCASCHQHNRPVQWTVTDGFTPYRGTDASGLYSVQAVLEDSGPVEHNRPRDLNREAPFVALDCPSGSTVVSSESRCADQTTARATLSLSSALAAQDPHALRVCESRRWLAEHSDPSVFAAFSAGFAACAIVSPNSM